MAERCEAVVIGAGGDRTRDRPRAGACGPRGVGPRTSRHHRFRDIEPQFRGDSRGHLLSDGIGQGSNVRKGQNASLRTLRDLQGALRAPRQDHRRDDARATRNPRGLPAPSARQRGGGASVDDPCRHRGPRARGGGRCGRVLGVHRNHRQPRLHAEPARGRRSRRRRNRLSDRGDRPRAGRHRGPRALRGFRPRRGHRRERHGTSGSGVGGATWGHSRRLLRQGPLLHAVRAITVWATDLPRGGGGGARCACDLGPRRTSEVRTRRGLAGWPGLRLRRRSFRRFRRSHPPLLPGSRRVAAESRLYGYPPETRAPGRAGVGLRDRRTRATRRTRVRQPARHRIARPDGVARDRPTGRRNAGWDRLPSWGRVCRPRAIAGTSTGSRRYARSRW